MIGRRVVPCRCVWPISGKEISQPGDQIVPSVIRLLMAENDPVSHDRRSQHDRVVRAKNPKALCDIVGELDLERALLGRLI